MTLIFGQKRHKEIASLLKQQGLDREQVAESKEEDDARWPKEVTLPPVNSIPAFKFYGVVSQCVTVRSDR